MISLATLAASTALCAGADAATIVNLTGASAGNYVDLTTASDKNLANNGAYSSGSGSSANAYVFGEGAYTAATNSTTSGLGIAGSDVQSFLLHYDRENTRLLGGLSTGTARGSFQIALDAGESFAGLVGYDGNVFNSFANAAALTATDPLSGVIYPNTTFTTTLFRGTEGLITGDWIKLSSISPSLVQVDYTLLSTGVSLDEVRFFVNSAAAVPEPANWAMMIGGFGLVGGALRLRKGKTVVRFA